MKQIQNVLNDIIINFGKLGDLFRVITFTNLKELRRTGFSTKSRYKTAIKTKERQSFDESCTETRLPYSG